MLPGMLPPRTEQIAELERLGESQVKYLLADATARINFDRGVASEWLRQKESARLAKVEAETLAVAKDAALAAKASASAAYAQARWAKYAAAIAAIMAIIAAKGEIYALIVSIL